MRNNPELRTDAATVRDGLRRLLRRGGLTREGVLAVPALTALPAAFGRAGQEAGAAVIVADALGRAIERSPDRDAARVLFAVAPSTAGDPLGTRRAAAAEIAEVTPDSFRVRREPRLLDDLARALLVELASAPSAGEDSAPAAQLEMVNALTRAVIRLAPAKSPFAIGRSPDCDVHVREDLSVSRQHASISLRGGRWVLEDLHSVNGTWVGSERVTGPTALNDGDVIRFGQTRLTFSLDRGEVLVTAIDREPSLPPPLSPLKLLIIRELIREWRRPSDATRPAPSIERVAKQVGSTSADVSDALGEIVAALGIEHGIDDRALWYPDVVRRALVLGLVDSEGPADVAAT